jgi:hypothetical protein
MSGFHNVYRTRHERSAQPFHNPDINKTAATVIRFLESPLGYGHTLQINNFFLFSRVSMFPNQRKQTVLTLRCEEKKGGMIWLTFRA